MKLCKVITLFGAITFAAQAQNSAPAPAAPPVVVPSQRLPLAPGSQLPPGVLRPGQVQVPPGAVGPGQVLPGQVVPGQNQPSRIMPLEGSAGPNNTMVPRFGATSNGVAVPSQQLAGTNGADFDRDEFRTNGFAGLTNSAGTNAFNPVTGTNGDVAVTAQDQALLGQIRARLQPEGQDALGVSVGVQNGVVTLSGIAPSAAEAQEFASIVQQTPGVVSVDNDLQVAGRGRRRAAAGSDMGFSTTDRELVGQIRRHMRQHPLPAGTTESVHILANNGVVTLVGFVSSVAEQQALDAAVQSTPGVVQVNDQLRVQAATAGQLNSQTGAMGAVGASTNSPGGVVTGFSTGTGAFGIPQPTAGAPGSNTNGFATNAVPPVPR